MKNPFQKTVQIKAADVDEAIAKGNCLFALGFKWKPNKYSSSKNWENHCEIYWREYPSINLKEDGTFDLYSGSFVDKVTLEEVISALSAQKRQVEVVLNKEYKAIVSKKGIQVGCQTFDFSIVNALQKAIDTVNEVK